MDIIRSIALLACAFYLSGCAFMSDWQVPPPRSDWQVPPMQMYGTQSFPGPDFSRDHHAIQRYLDTHKH
ncbi:hypothetical protein ABE525_22090 [Pseudomonas wadenswilerensis]|uniref:Lipoprotein n=1 Tax=Pseudomonas wadenswilerensis TaxID=1785161 RepID=A0A380STZ1_9PSED|nr:MULTISPECIES: hypothetical protein [Pseudomonas]MCE5984526.1 hypothetical protein [Pseudomonas sp. LF19]SUQ61054.1 hypothetical protein CCOS864_00460 [Pseudomonas wadenswilerensis]